LLNSNVKQMKQVHPAQGCIFTTSSGSNDDPACESDDRSRRHSVDDSRLAQSVSDVLMANPSLTNSAFRTVSAKTRAFTTRSGSPDRDRADLATIVGCAVMQLFQNVFCCQSRRPCVAIRRARWPSTIWSQLTVRRCRPFHLGTASRDEPAPEGTPRLFEPPITVDDDDVM
jgi:hypothetical protein